MIRWFSLHACLVAGVMFGFPVTPANADDVIKFGLISTFSGPGAPWGEAQSASVAIAVEEINSNGGIQFGGTAYTVEVIEYDHAYDPTQATTVARQAVHQDGVKFIEVLGGGVIPAVQTITEPVQVLLFGQGGGSAWIGEDKPFSFKPFYSIGDSAVAIMEHIREVDPEAAKIALVYPDDELGEATAEVAIEGGTKLGLTVQRVFVGRDTTDFYPLFASLLRDPPDYIDFGGMPGPQYASVANQGVENGYEGKFMFSSTLDEGAFKQLGATNIIEGSFVAPAWSTWTTEQGERWIQEMDRRVPGNRQMWTGRSYDNLMLLKAAIEQAGSLDTTEIREALEEVSVMGLSGEVRYSNRELVTPIPVGEIVLDADGTIKLEQVHERVY